MKLITETQYAKLLANGRAQRTAIDREDQAFDFKPSSSSSHPTETPPGS